jgi:hypothetical protein
MLRGGKFYKQGTAVINRLLKEGEIPYGDYVQIAGNREVAKEMLSHNVFSHHISTRTVTFQSMPMQVFCKTMGL